MEIKRTLKSLDVSISRLASDLGISRPTLDTYIDCYESGKPIPNQTYQDIFKYLFSSENINTVEFAKKFDYIKRTILNTSKNKDLGDNQTIKNAILDFIYSDNVSQEMLEFINLLVNNSKMELVVSLSDYFNYVNGLKKIDVENMAEDKKSLFSNLFKVFSNYKSGDLPIEERAFVQFIEKCEKMFDKKEEKHSSDELLDYLQQHLPEGSSIDMEYVKQLLIKKEN